MDLKAKIKEAKKSTKIAVVGGAIVVAGSWGSCQLELSDEAEAPAEEAVAPAEPAPAPEEAPAPAEEPAEAPAEEAPEGALEG